MLKNRAHFLTILGIVALAGLLRFWNLSNNMILFSDAGRDLLVAWEAVESRTLPLLGIPSSVPRFKQGPVSIWIMMAVFSLSGPNSAVIGYVFALISLLAVIGLYELLITDADLKKKPSVVLAATALLATFPLAVAHARVPYHTTPIPIMLLLYLWSLRRSSETKAKLKYLGMGFFWGLLFQFELALAPLIVMIAYVFFRKGQRPQPKQLAAVVAGIAISLFPQILHDLTHRFEQLGLFAAWVGYRIIAFFGYGGEHTVGTSKLLHFGESFLLYGTRIVGMGPNFLGLLGLSLVIIALLQLIKVVGVAHFKKRIVQLPVTVEYSLVATVLLIGGYFVHGSPSEAYYPPFFVLFAIILGYWLIEMASFGKKVAIGIVVILVVTNLNQIVASTFFSNQSQDFHYGEDFKDKQAVAAFLQDKEPFTLVSLVAPAEYDSYLDNYRWLLLEAGITESTHPSAAVYFIQPEHLESDPALLQFRPHYFGSVTVYSEWEQ